MAKLLLCQLRQGQRMLPPPSQCKAQRQAVLIIHCPAYSGLGLLSLVRLLLIGYHTRLAAARGAQSALGGTTTYGRPGRCARLHQHTTAAAAPARVVRRAGEVRKPQGLPPRPSCLPCRAAAPIRRLCTRQGWQQQGGSVTPLAAAARYSPVPPAGAGRASYLVQA